MKWTIQDNIIDLPEFREINLVCGVDRYGFSSLLAQNLGVLYQRRSFANWMHGWIWWGARSSEDLMMEDALKTQSRFIVSKFAEYEVLKSEGFKNVWVGGLPFAYTSPSKRGKVTGSLLAMPHHSNEQTTNATSNKLTKSLNEYLDYLESLKSKFSSVWISIYHNDISPAVLDEVHRRGLFAIEGARPNDANSLQRVRAILDTFEFLTTNTMGSHVIYAMFSGCKVSVIGPEFLLDESDFESKQYIKSSKKYIKDTIYYQSREYLKNEFSFLLINNPIYGYQDVEYARKEIGFYNKLTKSEIMNALQWSWLNQIKGYSMGGVRRINRLFD